MSAGYEKAIRAPDGLPNAEVCFDPFQVCPLGGRAADEVRREEYNRHGRSATGKGRWIKGARYSLLKDTANQTLRQLAKLAEVVATNKSMYRAFLLLGELRYIYRLPNHEAAERLDAWLAWASRSKLRPFIKLARTIRQHKAGVLAAIRLGINNVRVDQRPRNPRTAHRGGTAPHTRRLTPPASHSDARRPQNGFLLRWSLPITVPTESRAKRRSCRLG